MRKKLPHFIAPIIQCLQIPYDYTIEVTNRFKGLGLIDRLPEELWMEVRNTVQDAGLKPFLSKTNARRQSGCLSRSCKQLRKEDKLKAKEKRKDTPI